MKIKKIGKTAVFTLALGLFFASCDFVPNEDEQKGSQLYEGIWANGTISKDGQTDKYFFSVTKGNRYFIWLNDSYDGNSTKTAEKIGLKIYHSDDTVINGSYGNACGLFEKPFSFIAENSGTVTIVAASTRRYYSWETGTGTYAIKYTSRQEYDTLSKGIWKDDKILVDGQINRYIINITAGTKYSIYLNDAYEGDSTKTAERIGLKIYHSDDSVINGEYEKAVGLFKEPFTFTALNNGKVTIVAASRWINNSNWERGTGTYAIKYESNN